MEDVRARQREKLRELAGDSQRVRDLLDAIEKIKPGSMRMISSVNEQDPGFLDQIAKEPEGLARGVALWNRMTQEYLAQRNPAVMRERAQKAQLEERQKQAIEAGRPTDYATDSAQVKQAVDALAKRIESLEKTPALMMTASDYARDVSRVSRAATDEACTVLRRATRDFEKQTSVLKQYVFGARTSESQVRMSYLMLACGLVGGVVLAWVVTVTFV